MKKNKKDIVIVTCICLLLLIITGTSYALWQLVLVQTSTNTITTGCFKLTMEGNNDINIAKAHPVTSSTLERYLSLKEPYHFTITNTCDNSATVSINLESLNTQGNKLDDSYVNAILYDGDVKFTKSMRDYIYITDYWGENEVSQGLTSIAINNERVIEDAIKSYTLYNFDLKGNSSRSFNLLLYMNETAPFSSNSMNASWKGKVTIKAIEKNKDILKQTLKNNSIDGYNNYSNDHIAGDMREQIQKIVFQNTISPIEEDAIIEIDESLGQNNTIKGYIKNENGIMTLYIQTNGKIYLPTDSSYIFSGFTSLESIEGLEYIDTSNVTNMFAMFENCNNLVSLDLQHFNTSNVTNMGYMFSECTSLTNLDISNFNTSKVVNMMFLFYNCYSLDSINLQNFDTSNVINMSSMFEGCESLLFLDISNFNTSNVTNMSRLFTSLYINDLDVSSFDTSKVTDMHSMFSLMDNLTTLDLSNFNTENVVDMAEMFQHTINLTDIKLSNFNTSNVVDMSYMFSECAVLNLDISKFDTSKVKDMTGMFYSSYSLTNLDLTSFDTRRAENMGSMFQNTVIENITYGPKFIYNKKLTTYVSFMFENCPANLPPHKSWEDAPF